MVDAILHRWRVPPEGDIDLSQGVALTGAAEQMFFFDAPLAHVVAYEAWRREARLRLTYRRRARWARHVGLQLPVQSAGESA